MAANTRSSTVELKLESSNKYLSLSSLLKEGQNAAPQKLSTWRLTMTPQLSGSRVSEVHVMVAGSLPQREQ